MYTDIQEPMMNAATEQVRECQIHFLDMDVWTYYTYMYSCTFFIRTDCF
jgi:hypothetical protein